MIYPFFHCRVFTIVPSYISYNHNRTITSYYHTTLSYHTIIISNYNIILSYHTIISYYHIILLIISYRTITLSYYHTIISYYYRRRCGERKWANGWRKKPLHYGAIIRLHIRCYCCFKEGYSIYTGKASTLHCRRAKIIIIIIINNSISYYHIILARVTLYLSQGQKYFRLGVLLWRST